MTVETIPLDERHLENILNWLRNEDLRDLIGTVLPFSRSQHMEWYRRLCEDRTRLVLAIEENGRHVGMIGLHGIDLIYRNAELWIYLGDEASRGRGIASHAAQRVLHLAFDTLGLNRVFAYVFDFNSAAQSFFERLGMAREGVLRGAVFKRGKFWDKHVFGLLAEEFRRQQPD